MKLFLFPVMMVLASGCAIDADFDEYPQQLAGEALLGSIPGPPGGDMIISPTVDAAIVQDNVLNSSALHVSDIATFRATSHARPEIYDITWEGRRVSTGSGKTDILFVDQQDRAAVGLRVSQNTMSLLTGEASDAPLSFPLKSGAHSVRFLIGPGVANNLDLSVEFADGTVEAFTNLDPIDGTFAKLDRVTVDSQGGETYALNLLYVGLEN